MFDRIVVPLDGSAFAEQVLRSGSFFFRLSDAEVNLLTVVDMHGRIAGAEVPITCSGWRAKEYLAHWASRLQGMGLRVTTDVRFGDAVEKIILHARETHADLIAMTTHGRSGIERMIRGSVAEGILRQSDSPVFLLRSSRKSDGKQPRKGRGDPRILAPLDGTMDSEAVLPYVRSLALRMGAEVELLQVISDVPAAAFLPQSEPKVWTTVANQYLQSMVERLGTDGIRALPSVRRGDPAECILERAHSGEMSLVAMATHGRDGMGRMLRGSVAESVLRALDVPLLAVRVTQTVPVRP